jgi:hypothetical protein
VDGLILDNVRLALVRDTDMIGSIPKFVLDEDGARRFVPPWRNSSGGLSSNGPDPLLSFAFLSCLKQILMVRVRLSLN